MKRRPRVWTRTAVCDCGARLTVSVGPREYVSDVKHRPNTDEWKMRCVCGGTMTVTVGEIRRDAA